MIHVWIVVALFEVPDVMLCSRTAVACENSPLATPFSSSVSFYLQLSLVQEHLQDFIYCKIHLQLPPFLDSLREGWHTIHPCCASASFETLLLLLIVVHGPRSQFRQEEQSNGTPCNYTQPPYRTIFSYSAFNFCLERN